jgi:hypothetical protein
MSDKNTSENQENINTSTGENKFNLKPYKGDIYLIVALIILIILFPFGVIFYIWGRLNLIIHYLLLISVTFLPLMLIFFFIGIFRLLRKNTRKKKVLIFIEICLSIISFIPFDIHLNLYDSSHPFLCGYRDRIRSRLDIKTVREWMNTYSENYSSQNNNEYIDEYIRPEKLPDCLKPIQFGGVFTLKKDPEGYLSINQGCGATFCHWGLTIGMEDMPYPDAEFYKEHGLIWLPIAPGIYVDMD